MVHSKPLAILQEILDGAGTLVMGRKSFGNAEGDGGWGDSGPRGDTRASWSPTTTLSSTWRAASVMSRRDKAARKALVLSESQLCRPRAGGSAACFPASPYSGARQVNRATYLPVRELVKSARAWPRAGAGGRRAGSADPPTGQPDSVWRGDGAKDGRVRRTDIKPGVPEAGTPSSRSPRCHDPTLRRAYSRKHAASAARP
jgi:hypothetical protein